MSKRLGLIIGVNQYQDATFQPLQFAENDARALAQWLVNDKGGKWAPSDVQFVQGNQATRELVESLITQMCISMASPGDLALIYFAGHAFVDEKSGDGYLALSNTRYQEPATALHLLSFAHHIMTRSRATQIVCILDCFQTGPLWSRHRSSPYDFQPVLGPALLNLLPQQSNRLFLCSCRGNEIAPEAGERQLGAFTYRTIVGLCGPASDPATGTITLQQLYTYLLGTLSEQQRPQIFGQAHTPIVLVGTAQPDIEPQQGPLSTSSSPLSSSSMPMSAALNRPEGQPAAGAQAMGQSARYATATAQMSPQLSSPAASEQVIGSAVEQQRKQQIALLLNQAQQFLQAQNYPAAFNAVEQILQVAPDDIATLTLKGQILGTAGRFQEALAVANQLIQIDGSNALAWSMRAVLLSNMGEYKDALESIERSLELNASNPETYAIKTNIMASRAEAESKAGKSTPLSKKHSGPLSFFIGAVIQIGGLLIGIVGLILLVIQPNLPPLLGLGLASLGLAALCVNAARGSYLYGFMRLLFTLIICLVAGGILGAGYKFGYTKLLTEVNAHSSWLVPLLLLIAWLAAAAVIPFVLALGGFIGGLARGVRKRAR